MKALGMIETYGVIGAIEAADVMLKVAEVSLIKKEKVQGGLQLITVDGDVSAVEAAVDAGASAVKRLGENLLFCSHVIPRPDNQLESIVGREKKNSSKENSTHEQEVNGDTQLDIEVSPDEDSNKASSGDNTIDEDVQHESNIELDNVEDSIQIATMDEKDVVTVDQSEKKDEKDEESSVQGDKSSDKQFSTPSELRVALNRKRVSELKEMVMKNGNITLSEDEVQKMYKKGLINLLVSDFRKQKESNSQKEENK